MRPLRPDLQRDEGRGGISGAQAGRGGGPGDDAAELLIADSRDALRDVAARFADLYPDAADFDHAFPPLLATSDLDAQQARTASKQLSLF